MLFHPAKVLLKVFPFYLKATGHTVATYLRIRFQITIVGLWVEFHVGRTSGLIYQGLRPYFVYVDVAYIHLRLLEIQSDQPRKKMEDFEMIHK